MSPIERLSESQFLLWLANRMVNTYHEDPKDPVCLRVIEIYERLATEEEAARQAEEQRRRDAQSIH